uniref:(northern house mosquito) hypothetical protein n=1 Tax=Culex pipiens TaxID=7175 RepID=A0A8D8FLF1_CULPI
MADPRRTVEMVHTVKMCCCCCGGSRSVRPTSLVTTRRIRPGRFRCRTSASATVGVGPVWAAATRWHSSVTTGCRTDVEGSQIRLCLPIARGLILVLSSLLVMMMAA